ncbi:MAG TPA: right-handed parallel beta-helix repeat-containing protein [Patescibacteria group bacterium]|nr:right-handed parallel beta-helix repeat-containing protein [Patescibacteria group bacterium]
MKWILYFISFVFLISLAQADCIGSTSNFTCGQTINQSCILNQSEVCPSTGFVIGAPNIILDGNGFTLNYSSTATAYAINNTAGYDNVTIQNFNIYQTTTQTLSQAIYMYSSENSTIQNNNISTRGNYGYAIYFNTNCHRNRVLNNRLMAIDSGVYTDPIYFNNNVDYNLIDGNFLNMSTASNGIYIVTNADYNNITNNIIITSTYNSAYGIRLQAHTNAYVYNNNITTNYYGIRLSTVYNGNVTNNYINSNGAGATCYIDSGNNNTLNNNTFIMNSIGQGVHIVSSPRNVLINNIINSSRSNSVWIDASVLNELPSVDYVNYNQSIDTSNLAEGYPILFNYSLKNQVVLENINVNETYGQIICAGCKNVTYNNVTASGDGINFFGTRDSIISNSLINTNKGYGIVLFTNSYNNTIFNNTLIETGSIYYLYRLYVLGNSNNISYNNITTSGLSRTGVLISAYGNNINNNYVSTTGSGRYAIQIGGKGNQIDNNILQTSGGGSAHPIVDSGGENTYTNNQIKVLGTTSHGTYITSADSIYINNTFNNSIAGGYSAFTFGNNAHRNRIINSTFITTSTPGLLLYQSGTTWNNSIENSIFVSTTGAKVRLHTSSLGSLNIINCSTLDLGNISFDTTSNVTVNIQNWNELVANYSNGTLVSLARINYTDETNTLRTYFTGGDLPSNQGANDVLNMSGNILYYKFNEASGDIIDYAGIKNATTSNVTYGSDGIKNRTGVYFAGSNSTTKRWIDVGNDTVYDLRQNITSIVWVKYADQYQWCDVFSKGYDASWAFKGTTTPNWRIQLTTNGDKSLSLGATAVNRWYMLAGTYDGLTSKAYRDGYLVSNATYSADTLKTTPRRIMLGMDSQSGTYGDVYPAYPSCNMWLGEVLIFNRTLSADEIKAYYDISLKSFEGQGESIGMTNISMNRTTNATITNFTMTAYKNGTSVERTVLPQSNILTNFLFILDSCTPPAIGNWDIVDDCILNVLTVIDGNVSISNNGSLTLNNILRFSGLNKIISLYPNSQMFFNSGGGLG